MVDDLHAIGEAAIDRFITTWNSRDPQAWAGSLHFPHVRPSPFGDIVVTENAEAYIAGVDFGRVAATGWDHSEWDYKHVLHVSQSKIHGVGQWSRYNSDGEVILTNPVTYIVTNIDGDWGIQSRFSADYAGDDDTSAMESRAFKLIKDFIAAANSGNTPACAELLNYPHIDVGTGRLTVTERAKDFSLSGAKIEIESMLALQTGKRSINVAMDITMSDTPGTRHLQAVLNVTERDDHLGIQAWSFLDPGEIDED